MIVRRLAPLVLLFASAAALGGCIGTAGGAGTSGDPSPDSTGTVLLQVRHSKFSPSSLVVRRGQTVRFVVENRDPIPHELIVGDQAVQDVHEQGAEAHHGDRPGEVSVAPGASAETTVTFAEPGQVLFGCHLPGHWDYGMRGTIRVV